MNKIVKNSNQVANQGENEWDLLVTNFILFIMPTTLLFKIFYWIYK